MKALIIKDFLNLKHIIKSQFQILLVFIALGFITKNLFFIISILAVLSISYNLTCFAYDENSRFYSYGLALPINRKDIVFSRYVTSYIVFLVTSMLILLLTYMNSIIFNISNYFISITLLFVSVLLIAIFTPIAFKFGLEKAKISMIFSVSFLPIVLINIFKSLNLNINLNSLYLKIIPMIILLIVSFVSIKLSTIIVSKKDF